MRVLLAAVTLATLSAIPKCDACSPKPLSETTHVIARSPTRMSLDVLEDGTLLLDANVETFEVTKDDTIALLGDFASYEPFLPTMDDPGAPLRLVPRTLYGTRSLVEARGTETSFMWNGARWEKKAIAPVVPIDSWEDNYVHALNLVPRTEPPKDVELPKDFHVKGWTRANDGTRIAFGRERPPNGWTTELAMTVFLAPNERVARRVLFEPNMTAQWYCHPVPAADSHTYASCIVPDIGEPERRIYRVESAAWKRVPLPLRGPATTPIAIGKDGSVWVAKTDPPRVVHALNGRVEELVLEAIRTKVEQASYTRKKLYSEGSRDRDRLDLESPTTSALGKLAQVMALVPRPSGRVFALVLEAENEATVLYRLGEGSERAKTPIPVRAIGSEPDQLVEIGDAARETQKWVGHCRQVFIELADARAARVASERANGDGTVWTAVEGKLKKRHVFGVVALSVTTEADATFERTVTNFIESLTKNPASPPPATCSLPVLDRLL